MKVKLSPRQARQLMPYFDRVRATGALGTPGMLVAQLRHDAGRMEYYMDVGFIEHEKALPIINAATREIPP